MATISLTLQNVNGDPATTGANINITTGTTVGAVFNETSGSVSLETVLSNDTVTIGGFTYSYVFLGSGYVRNDPNQLAAFIRITAAPSGAPIPVGTTYAIDLSGQPGDPAYPDLQNGNTQLTVAALDKTTPQSFPGVPCFAAGTMILTTRGEVAIETLSVGDLVRTLDCGDQPIRWIGRRWLRRTDLVAHPRLAPVRIRAGALGSGLPNADLVVSPQHRILVRSRIAERVFGVPEVLIPANKLLPLDGVDILSAAEGVQYLHLLFDTHHIIHSNGAPTESLFTGPEAMKSMRPAARREIEAIFPELARPDFLPAPARLIPRKGTLVRALVERHVKNAQPLLRDFA